MAFFRPVVVSAVRTAAVLLAGRELLEAVGCGTWKAWLSVGCQSTRERPTWATSVMRVVDFTALGDPVNVGARMHNTPPAV